MEMVTGFNSEIPASGKTTKVEIENIFKALEFSSEAALDVFTRHAKQYLVNLVSSSLPNDRVRTLVINSDTIAKAPIWVNQQGAIFHPKQDRIPAERLEILVEALWESIKLTGNTKSETLVFLNSLETRILGMPGGLFSFTVKQRWAWE
jgi:hypothetical protein